MPGQLLGTFPIYSDPEGDAQRTQDFHEHFTALLAALDAAGLRESYMLLLRAESAFRSFEVERGITLLRELVDGHQPGPR